MKYKIISIEILIFCCLVLFIVGCATAPVYISKELENRPTNEIVKLIIDLRVRNMQIDGQKIRTTRGGVVYLGPSEHTLKYEEYGETDRWKLFVLSMAAKGFRLGKDGRTFLKCDVVGGCKSATPLGGFRRFGWNARSKKVSLEGGRTYTLSDVWKYRNP